MRKRVRAVEISLVVMGNRWSWGLWGHGVAPRSHPSPGHSRAQSEKGSSPQREGGMWEVQGRREALVLGTRRRQVAGYSGIGSWGIGENEKGCAERRQPKGLQNALQVWGHRGGTQPMRSPR